MNPNIILNKNPIKTIIKAVPLNYVQTSFGVSSLSLKLNNSFKNTNIEAPYEQKSNNKKKVSIIFLHGLFGSSDNFRLTNKLLIEKFNYGFLECLPPLVRSPDPLLPLSYPLPSQELLNEFISPDRKDINVDLFSLDLRNHGSSPHTQEVSLKHIEKDLHYFIDRIVLNNNKKKDINQKIILIGHSAGGKAGMLFALNNPNLVDGLVNIDVSPSNYIGVHNHDSKFNAMIESSKLFGLSNTTKKDIDKKLEEFNLNKGERLYLLNNLVENEKKFGWRINVDSLFENQNKLLSFPRFNSKKQFNKKVLFIGGAESHYLKDPFRKSINPLFPNNEIHLLQDASHFCFAEKTKIFSEKLYYYLKEVIRN